jgi:Ca-activated chloride channel family protein
MFSARLGPVPLTGVKVEADILGRGARVRLSQMFRNTEKQPVEAVYKFPLPETAAICGFRARVDGRVIRGKVEEREKAFEMYDEVLTQGDGGYLLEEERPNVFTLSVGNLNPGSEVIVEIDYVTLLELEGEKIRFFLPTTISPRYIPDHMDDADGIPQEEKLHPPYALDVPYGLSLYINVHDGKSLKSIASPSHAIQIDLERDPVRLSFVSETVRMDRDFILYLQRSEATPAGKAYRFQEGNDTFVHLDICPQSQGPPREPGSEDRRGSSKKEVIFLLDCSGSMMGDSITEAKKAMEICLRGLAKGTRFNIYRFGSSFDSLFTEPVDYTESSLERAVSYLAKTDADLGGTEIHAPLEHIYSTAPRADGTERTVLLLTDGEVGNEEQVIRLVRDHRNSTRFFSIGIGAGPNEFFIKGLGRAGLGAWEFIHPGERVEPKVLRMFEKLMSQPISAPVIRWGHGVVEQAPAIPGMFLDSPVTVFARFHNQEEPGNTITIETTIAGEEHRWEIDVVDVGGDEIPIPVLWARERIRDIEEGEGLSSGKGSRQKRRKDETWRKAVIELSMAYGLLSGSTSYIAVEEREEKDKTTGELVLRKVPVPLTVGWHGIGRAAGIPCYGPTPHASSQTAYYSMEAAVADEAPSQEARFCRGSFISRMSTRPGPMRPAEDRIDRLLAVLTLQRAEGGIDLTEEAAMALALDLVQLRKEAKSMKVDCAVDKFLLLSTAVLLEVLETLFSAEKAIWAGVVEKSQEWLSGKIRDANPRISGMCLTEWAKTWVKAMPTS